MLFNYIWLSEFHVLKLRRVSLPSSPPLNPILWPLINVMRISLRPAYHTISHYSFGLGQLSESKAPPNIPDAAIPAGDTILKSSPQNEVTLEIRTVG
jgi:hypothetical protein